VLLAGRIALLIYIVFYGIVVLRSIRAIGETLKREWNISISEKISKKEKG